jgi:hypothetical protein
MQVKPAAAALLFAASLAQAAEVAKDVASTAADREAVAVTVYNDDLALVKERRKLDLPAGLTRLSLREVAAQMRPETALLRAVSGPPFALVEQNFDFDLLTPQKLLEKYVGRQVTVIRPHPTSTPSGAKPPRCWQRDRARCCVLPTASKPASLAAWPSTPCRPTCATDRRFPCCSTPPAASRRQSFPISPLDCRGRPTMWPTCPPMASRSTSTPGSR